MAEVGLVVLRVKFAPGRLPGDLVQDFLLEPPAVLLEVFLELGLNDHELVDGLEEVDTDIVEVLYEKLDAVSPLEFGSLLEFLPVLRGLQSEGIRDFELIPDDHSGSVVLGLLLRELAHVEIANWLVRSKDLRQQSCLCPGEEALVGCFVASVDKAIGVLVVSVQIAEDRDTSGVVFGFTHGHLQKVELWMEGGVRVAPPSVEVNTSQ